MLNPQCFLCLVFPKLLKISQHFPKCLQNFPKLAKNFQKFPKISPQDKFLSTIIICDISDKYELCAFVLEKYRKTLSGLYWALGTRCQYCVWRQDKGCHNQIPNTASDPSANQQHLQWSLWINLSSSQLKLSSTIARTFTGCFVTPLSLCSSPFPVPKWKI